MASNANGTEAPGTGKFGRYVVHRLLGEGGMGRVYLAQDPVLQRDVAVKVVILDTQLDDITRREYLSRFSLEARASAKLHHQSIVSVHDAGEEDGVPWIAFEFVEGERLDKLLRHEGKLPVNEAVSIALDMASALQHAHNSGIIHRDIKPSNILIDRSTGIAKLADFGIVKAPWTVLTRQGDVVGSPGYMSPEQINGFELDGRTDLFSLGVVFYEMIAGKHPFLRDTVQSTLMATLGGKHMPLNEVCSNVPQAAETAISKCLMSDRSKRIQTAEEFTELLTSHPSLASYQSGGSRKALGGMAQKIAMALKNGALNGHTRRMLQSQFMGAQKFFRFLIELVSDCAQLAGSFLKRIVHRAPSTAKTQIGSSPVKGRTAGNFFGKILKGPMLVVSGFRMFMRKLSLRVWIITAVIIVSMIGILIPVLWFVNSNVTVAALQKSVREGTLAQALDAARELKKRGVSWLNEELLDRCRSLLDQDNIELAAMAAQKITELAPGLPQGHVLYGRVALKCGEYDNARNAFLQAKKLDKGKAVLQKKHVQILADISKELMRGEAPPSLIRMGVVILSSEDEPLIRSWLQSENYWLRWNSVKLLHAGNKKVDMVDIYIYDLKYCKQVKMRINAVHKLGEMKDLRAVTALMEAAVKRESDPKVARAAKLALKK